MLKRNAATEDALSELKGALKQVISHFEADPNVVLGNCYLTSSEESYGLVSRPVPKKIVALELSFLSTPAVERLETSLFRKVTACIPAVIVTSLIIFTLIRLAA